MAVVLEPRLRAAAAFVPKGASLGDIGTDHAYLPIALCEAGGISGAVAVDVHEGPYRSAVAAVKSRGLENVIDVRFGDGLAPLRPGEVDTLTLTGMGGRTMLEILSARPDVLESVKVLILQPQNTEAALRLTLLNRGWRLKAEKLVQEDERIYVIMVFVKDGGWDREQLNTLVERWGERMSFLRGKKTAPDKGRQKDELQKDELQKDVPQQGVPQQDGFRQAVQKLVWHFGPLILEEYPALLLKAIDDYVKKLEIQREQMKKSKNIEILAKLRVLSEELAAAEGLRTWQ